MKPCKYCGYSDNPKDRKPKLTTKVDELAYALYLNNNQMAPNCCSSFPKCSCWTGWRGDAKVAIRTLRGLEKK